MDSISAFAAHELRERIGATSLQLSSAVILGEHYVDAMHGVEKCDDVLHYLLARPEHRDLLTVNNVDVEALVGKPKAQQLDIAMEGLFTGFGDMLLRGFNAVISVAASILEWIKKYLLPKKGDTLASYFKNLAKGFSQAGAWGAGSAATPFSKGGVYDIPDMPSGHDLHRRAQILAELMKVIDNTNFMTSFSNQFPQTDPVGGLLMDFDAAIRKFGEFTDTIKVVGTTLVITPLEVIPSQNMLDGANGFNDFTAMTGIITQTITVHDRINLVIRRLVDIIDEAKRQRDSIPRKGNNPSARANAQLYIDRLVAFNNICMIITTGVDEVFTYGTRLALYIKDYQSKV